MQEPHLLIRECSESLFFSYGSEIRFDRRPKHQLDEEVIDDLDPLSATLSSSHPKPSLKAIILSLPSMYHPNGQSATNSNDLWQFQHGCCGKCCLATAKPKELPDHMSRESHLMITLPILASYEKRWFAIPIMRKAAWWLPRGHDWRPQQVLYGWLHRFKEEILWLLVHGRDGNPWIVLFCRYFECHLVPNCQYRRDSWSWKVEVVKVGFPNPTISLALIWLLQIWIISQRRVRNTFEHGSPVYGLDFSRHMLAGRD